MNVHVNPEDEETVPVSKRVLSGIKNLMTTISRASLFSRLGITHDGKRDLYDVFGYKTNLSYDDYFDKYIRQDIAGRAVDAFPQATWGSAPRLDGTKTFLKAWNNFNNQFQIWNIILRLDRLLGLGQYAVLYLGLNDNRPSDSAPGKPRGGLKVLYIQPLSEKTAKVKEYETDPKNPRFGLPKIYSLQLEPPKDQAGGVTSQTPIQSRDIHWMRCIHVVEDPLENEVFGVARLQRVYNVLDDLLKVCGGSAETFWITANRGMQADVDKDMSFTNDDAAKLTDEIDEYIHGLRRFIRTRGVKVSALGSDTPDPRGTFDILVTMLSAALGIPKRILLGSEAGQLASEQDRTNWANRIEERRTNFAEPRVIFPLFNRLTDLGILPKGLNKIIWPSAFRMSPFERSQTAAQKARSAANLAKLFPAPPKPLDPNAQAKLEADQNAQDNAQNQPQIPGNGGQPLQIEDKRPQSQRNNAQKPAKPGDPAQTPKNAEYEPLLTRDEARAIILIDEIQPTFADDADDVSRSET